VLGGTTYVATALKLPGLIEQTGTHRRIAFGESFSPAAQVSERVERIAEVLATGDIQVETFPDARVPIWEKFIYLSPVAAFTATARLPTGRLGHPFIGRFLGRCTSRARRASRDCR
jgi:2-dehydropantoate 2-reductase